MNKKHFWLLFFVRTFKGSREPKRVQSVLPWNRKEVNAMTTKED